MSHKPQKERSVSEYLQRYWLNPFATVRSIFRLHNVLVTGIAEAKGLIRRLNYVIR